MEYNLNFLVKIFIMNNKIYYIGVLFFCAGCLQAVIGQNLNEGLLAYYPFNGNAKDETGNGYDGNVAGATLDSDRFGAKKSAYKFSRNRQLITLSNTKSKFNFLKSSYSISAWVKWIGGQNGTYLISKWKPGNPNSFGIGTEGLKIRAFIQDLYTPLVITSKASMSKTKWSHVVMVIHGSESIALYFNNKLEKRVEISSKYSVDNNYPVTIGGAQPDFFGTRTFRGLIDDVRIYSRALSKSEIDSLYKLESQPTVVKPPLLLNLSMNPISFGFKTEKGVTYEIQASGDLTRWNELREWNELKEIDGTGEAVKFIDVRKAYYEQQFYRVRVGD